ncbi:hypothetical protein jhhlp_005336, partial [Lomentospora prolificans]
MLGSLDCWTWLLFLSLASCTAAEGALPFGSERMTRSLESSITAAPLHNTSHEHHAELKKRQSVNNRVTCGYLDGDADKPRSAESGFNCRVDTERGLWGFCPTSVIAASDCGLAGNCVDKHSCSRGCGIRGMAGITTFTCQEEQFCSTLILALGTDADFSYIACGALAVTETLFPTPTIDPTTAPASGPSSTLPPESTQPADSSSTPQSDQTLEEPQSQSPSNNTGAIIGGVLGGLALICISVIATVFILRRSRSTKAAPDNMPSAH